MEPIIIFCIVVLGIISVYLLWLYKSKNTSSVVSTGDNVPNREAFLFGLSRLSVSHEKLAKLIEELSKRIVGDKKVLHGVVAVLLAKGHILVQGQPGTGKTTLVRALAEVLDASYNRVQCTPDLLPQDVLGVEVYNAQNGEFVYHSGPILANILHVDEINRATPKLQSAFLQAMQEKNITIGNNTIELPNPFFVIATQNPYDAIGTYMLPYAQIDRFMGSIQTLNLTKEEYHQLLASKNTHIHLQQTLSLDEIKSIQNGIECIHISENIIQYAIECIQSLEKYSIQLSTRALESLLAVTKAGIYLQGKSVAQKEDVDMVMGLVLRHRVSHLVGREITDEDVYRLISGVAQKDDIVG